ncbi:MAG: hypothetical protein KGL39_30185 [Patescibacteria group bacterium]|nr:hypothetical protein [Patescibacteria group bacterium]
MDKMIGKIMKKGEQEAPVKSIKVKFQKPKDDDKKEYKEKCKALASKKK